VNTIYCNIEVIYMDVNFMDCNVQWYLNKQVERTIENLRNEICRDCI